MSQIIGQPVNSGLPAAAPAPQPAPAPVFPQLPPPAGAQPPPYNPAPQPQPNFAPQPLPPYQPQPPFPNPPGPYPAPVPPAGGQPSGPAAPQGPSAPVGTPTQQADQRLAQLEQELRMAQQSILRNQPYVSLGQQAAAQRQQQFQQPQTQPAGQPASLSGVPPFDPAMERFLGRDGNGQLTELPGAPPGTLAAYHANREGMASFLQRFAVNPEAVLSPVVEARAKALVAEETKRQFAEARQQQDFDSMVAEVSPWAIARDANGMVIQEMNYLTGQFDAKMTPEGQMYMQALAQAEVNGIRDPRQKHQHGMKVVTQARQQQQQQQAQQQQQQAQQYARPFFAGLTGPGALAQMPVMPQFPQQPPQYQAPQPQQVYQQFQPQPGYAPQYMPPPVPNQNPQLGLAPPPPGRPGPRPTMLQLMYQNAAAMGLPLQLGR